MRRRNCCIFREPAIGGFAISCGTGALATVRTLSLKMTTSTTWQALTLGGVMLNVFLEFLRNHRSMAIDAIPEESLFFPREPMVRVRFHC